MYIPTEGDCRWEKWPGSAEELPYSMAGIKRATFTLTDASLYRVTSERQRVFALANSSLVMSRDSTKTAERQQSFHCSSRPSVVSRDSKRAATITLTENRWTKRPREATTFTLKKTLNLIIILQRNFRCTGIDDTKTTTRHSQLALRIGNSHYNGPSLSKGQKISL